MKALLELMRLCREERRQVKYEDLLRLQDEAAMLMQRGHDDHATIDALVGERAVLLTALQEIYATAIGSEELAIARKAIERVTKNGTLSARPAWTAPTEHQRNEFIDPRVQTAGVRCHGDACCAGQLPCPTPKACGVDVPPVVKHLGEDTGLTD